MSAKQRAQKSFTVVQGKPVEDAMRDAVRHALLEHKRAGNAIATWKDGKVVIVPAEEIAVEETPSGANKQ